MQRCKFNWAFKLDTVKLALERGVFAAQEARDLDVYAIARAVDHARFVRIFPFLTLAD